MISSILVIVTALFAARVSVSEKVSPGLRIGAYIMVLACQAAVWQEWFLVGMAMPHAYASWPCVIMAFMLLLVALWWFIHYATKSDEEDRYTTVPVIFALLMEGVLGYFMGMAIKVWQR